MTENNSWTRTRHTRTERPGAARMRAGSTKRTAFALVAMGLAVITIANDFTAFSVAIPTMETQLHASLSTVQWVINAYALIFGVAIVTGGRLADMFGRRRVFLIGTAIFALFSLASGLAPTR